MKHCKRVMKKGKYIIILLLTTTIVQNCCNGQNISRYDVVISEIMADPAPTVGLPEAEYIELHNRKGTAVALNNWSISIGNTNKTLPTIYLDSAGYAIVTAAKYAESFVPICSNIYTLSSLSLTDGGQTLILYNENRDVIHSVSYKKSWHTESIKQDGGWALEMLDERYPCLGKENWNSSTAEAGGTPSAPNASARDIEDFTPPSMERVTLLDSTTIRVFFTKSVLPSYPISTDIFSLSPNIPIDAIKEVPPNFSALDISLSEALHPNVHYLLTANGALCDCAGNVMRLESLPVGIASIPNAGDIVINEVLAHPYSGTDADFIEIFNRSSKIIDLKNVKIGSGGDTMPNKAVCAVSSGRQLFPQEYCALCKDRELTLQQYDCPVSQALQQCDSLPAYAIASGVVYLSTTGLRTIDRFAYSEEMHYSGLTSSEGVSLERLNAEAPTQDESNWHSAASTSGFATPGYRNSQTNDGETTEGISIVPEVFSPDNDGFDDYTEFELTFPDIENRVSVLIFNKRGALVRHLANNEPCGNIVHYRWDGTDDRNVPLPSDLYVAVIQWWNGNGKTKSVRKSVGIVKYE